MEDKELEAYYVTSKPDVNELKISLLSDIKLFEIISPKKPKYRTYASSIF